MNRANTQNVLLDLGVVLLHLNYDDANRRCLPLCNPAQHRESARFLSLLGRSHLVEDYESGKITSEAFFQYFKAQTGFIGSFDQFVEIWRSIFTVNEPMVRWATEIARRYPIYILTNASPLHVPWVFDRFPELRFFQDYACSCYLGVSKPAPEFYTQALANFNIAPESCLFIDDRPENIAASEHVGIHSILYTDPSETIALANSTLNFA